MMYANSRTVVKPISINGSPASIRRNTPKNSPNVTRKETLTKTTKKQRSLESKTAESDNKFAVRRLTKASSLEEDSKSGVNSARSLNATDALFGRIVRSSSASRTRDLITATLEIPGIPRQNSKEDSESILLESYNNNPLSSRTTFPSRKSLSLLEEASKSSRKLATTVPSPKIRVHSAERGKQRNNIVKAKIGPCKCKACTLRREKELAANEAEAKERANELKETVDDNKKSNGEKISKKKIVGKSKKKSEKEAKNADSPSMKPKQANKNSQNLPKEKTVKENSSLLKENKTRNASSETVGKSDKQAKTKKKKGKPKKSESAETEKTPIEFLDILTDSEDDRTLVPEDFLNFADLKSVNLELLETAEGALRRIKPNDSPKIVRNTVNIAERSSKFANISGNEAAKKYSESPGPPNSEDTFILRRSGTEMSCYSSFCFEEMKTTDHNPTLKTGDFGFLDFSKQMGGGLVEREATEMNLATNENNREIIKSRLGSRVDNTPGAVIQWKRGPMLGRGAFGTVWCGLTITGELIAVKQAEVIAMNTEKAQREYEKIQGEVELLKSLNHPNIVGYLGTCLDGRVVSIFMQYIPGGSVAGILKKFGPLAEPVFARYTRQIVDGIAYLHGKNVIHRDIKGSNLVLMPNGTVKLIDFGCAKKIMNLNASNSDLLLSMKGTPYWMAPEVINETGHGPKSDVWCVGCVVFEMAFARPPWSHLNKYAALFAISSGNSVPKLSEKFSSEARNFVATCLVRNPDKRPTAIHLLSHPFCRNFGQENQSKIHDSMGAPRNSANRSKRL